MAFSSKQLRQLQEQPYQGTTRARQVERNNRLEGAVCRALSEANRIFGFDGWDRETISSDCVWQKSGREHWGAAYITRVKLTVRAGDKSVVREGLGSGEAYAPTSGQAHERAAKAAETDATKRALSTFGHRFCMSVGCEQPEKGQVRAAFIADKNVNSRMEQPVGDNELRHDGSGQAMSLPVTAYVLPPARTPVDKSALSIGEPKRLRSSDHLRFVAQQPCTICGRQPADAHHLRFAQPRALARKVSDEFTVPLCRSHHDELHRTGNEIEWWRTRGIDALKIARSLWLETRPVSVGSPVPPTQMTPSEFRVAHVTMRDENAEEPTTHPSRPMVQP